MKNEIHALENNKTWILINLPKKKAIDSKWVYMIKYKANGVVECYKARLVMKGFTQIKVLDFHETFAPIENFVTVRTILAVAVKQKWSIHQPDVNNAFMHGDLEEEVYMKLPLGFIKTGDTYVYKLQNSLYRLRKHHITCMKRLLMLC